jgi:hypothetical protein
MRRASFVWGTADVKMSMRGHRVPEGAAVLAHFAKYDQLVEAAVWSLIAEFAWAGDSEIAAPCFSGNRFLQQLAWDRRNR